MKQTLSCIALMASLLIVSPMGAIAQSDVIEARKANFKQTGRAMRQMRGQLQSADYDAIAKSAEQIAAWAAQMPDFFPASSGPDNNRTDAKASIWQNFQIFTTLAKANEDAALHLAQAAKAGASDEIMDKMQSLGKTCGACHSQFKN